MAGRFRISQKVTALLVYSRPLLVFSGLICAVAVMWGKNPVLYTLGVTFLFISMTFDLVDGWFAARFQVHPTLAHLADRMMDQIVYSIIFPLVAVGVMWRLVFFSTVPSRMQLFHAVFTLILCVAVLVRNSFANFMRTFAIRKGQEPELKEFTRLRTAVAAPVGALLYAHAFYIPEGPPSALYFWISWMGNIPLQVLFFIEIIFLIINFGSIAGYAKKYGSYCLDELCLGDALLRRKILSFFPNALTVMNAIMGLLAVLFAYQGRIREAYLLLIGAALFDKLDGAVARKLGLTEPPPDSMSDRHIALGAILDDVSDGLSFCVVPAWIFYICLSGSADPVVAKLPIWLPTLLYPLLGIARLVYFTLDRNPIPGFFKGMPSPAAALLVIPPLILFSQAAPEAAVLARFWAIFSFFLMICSAVAMNLYPVRYLHGGRFMDTHPWFARTCMALLLVSLFSPYFGYVSLSLMILYLFSPLVTYRMLPARH